MMRLIGIVIASAILFGTVPAKADFLPNLDGWYIEGRGGVPLHPHAEARVEGAGFNGEYDEDDGFAIGVSAGAYFAPNWRGELEFGWTHGEDGTFFISNVAPVPHTGEVDVYSGLINVFHELPIQNEIWRPYFGAGIGIAVFDFDSLGGGAFFTEGSEVTFNGALHAGIDFPINETFIFTTRLTGGITSKATFNTETAAGAPAVPNVVKDAQFYGFFSAGIRIMLGGLTQ